MSSLALGDMRRQSLRYLNSPNANRAERWLKKVLRHHPTDYVSLVNLASLHYNNGRDDDALMWMHEASKQPGARESDHYNYIAGLINLKNGYWEQGWEGFDYRFAVGASNIEAPHCELWDGSYIGPERSLVLWNEQGLGDQIQMARFAKDAKERSGAHVKMVVAPSLVNLLAPLADEVTDHVTIGEGDVSLPLFSLPRIFSLSVGNVSGKPYIKRPRARKDASSFTVGLCWQGNRETPELRDRSIPEEELGPIRANCDWVSLQYGMYGFEPEDWMDTAKAAAKCDLVITIDTSLAHLCGAMGIPTWTMLRHQGDWRWLRTRNDTPWYSSMVLYRQPKMHDWPSLVQKIVSDLKEKIKNV